MRTDRIFLQRSRSLLFSGHRSPILSLLGVTAGVPSPRSDVPLLQHALKSTSSGKSSGSSQTDLQVRSWGFTPATTTARCCWVPNLHHSHTLCLPGRAAVPSPGKGVSLPHHHPEQRGSQPTHFPSKVHHSSGCPGELAVNTRDAKMRNTGCLPPPDPREKTIRAFCSKIPRHSKIFCRG